MTERPRFDKAPETDTFVSAAAFNELVDFYNDLADAYEELFVEMKIEAEAQSLLDGRTLAVLQSVHSGVKAKIKKEGYDAYARQALTQPKIKATA